MGDGGCALGPDATQKRAIADAGGTKDNVLSVGQIVGRINSIEFFFVTLFDQFFSFFLIARPHFALHVAAETFDSRRRQHRFGRAADSHVKIDAAVGNGGRHCRRDVAVPDHAKGRARAADFIDHFLVPRAVEHHDDDVLHTFVHRARHNGQRFGNGRLQFQIIAPALHVLDHARAIGKFCHVK